MPRIATVTIAFILSAVPHAVHAAPTVEDFARLPTFSDLLVSPGGRYLAARVNNKNVYAFTIFDISGPKFVRVHATAEDDEYSIRWFRWVSPKHLVASLTFSAERGRNVQTTETRLFAIDAETQAFTPIFRQSRSEIPVQIQDNVVSYLPQDPERILLQYSQNDPSQPDVYAATVTRTGRHKRVVRGRPGIYAWMADRHGEVRLGRGVNRNGIRQLIIKKANDKDWLDFSHRVNAANSSFVPMAFAQELNQMYVASNHEGDPNGLYLFDITTDEFLEEIFQHPSVDIANINVDGETGELLSINFVEDDVATVRLSRHPMSDDVDALLEQLPGKSASLASITEDNNYAIVMVQGGGDAGTYFLLDRKTPSIRRLPAQYPGLSSEFMGKTISTSYEARDGLTIPAFVTLPAGTERLDSVSELPFVILPHGGPAARDFLRFDYWVQFLVAQGYGVLQMNFRGSAGYGQSFEDAGDREWGQAMQDDITDGVNWLVDNGHADRERVAIMGGSYGGYAALMGAVKTPDLYQCAVSFAGVSDLPDLIRTQRKYVGGRHATRFIGDLWQDRKMLAENSPARRAADIMVPILLFHGDDDVSVNIDQSTKMARALRKNDKQFDYVRFENGDHHLSLYDHRLEFLTKSGEFLKGCLN